MPCHVSSGCPVTSTSRAMPWPLQPHLFFYASFKNPLSWPLHFMFLAMHVDEDMLSRVKMPCPYRGISCAFLVPVSWHALFPCHGMPCQASRLPLFMAWHALSGPCYAMPCDVSSGLPGDKHKSCHAMSCLARCHALSCFHLRVMFLAIARWQAQVVPCLA